MGVLLSVLFALLACLLGGLYYLGAFRQQRPGEPPLDRGPIPWLGHVLEFRRDTAKFLERMKRENGDIFTVQLGGFYFTFLMDPLSFGAFVKESRTKLDFRKFAIHLVARVFGYESTENERNFLQVTNNKHLMGDGLSVMTQSMMGNLQNLMLHSVGSGHDQNLMLHSVGSGHDQNLMLHSVGSGHDQNLMLHSVGSGHDQNLMLHSVGSGHDQNLMLHSVGSGHDQKDWVEDGLFMYSYNIVFRAGYLALFGNETPQGSGGLEKAKEMDRLCSNTLFYEFRKYDQLFPKLAYGVLPPGEKREADRLLKLFWSTLSVQKVKAKDNISGWVWDQQQLREENGMQESMQDRYMFLLLWASQGNTGPSAFWLLLYLMKHPEAMKAVKAEVEEVLRETGQEVKRGGPLIDLTRDMLMRTPVLDSAVEETLRLSAAPVLTRAVLQDMTLKMADGREYAVREGDRVALFPYTAVQTDPEVYPDPLSFKYDRFLNPDGSRKTDFHKAGKKLKYYNMPWGAGATKCPGRFFATNELKQFIFLMLIYFDFELKNPDEEMPDIDRKRWGFGSMQPCTDIQFRYRLRF